MPTPAAEAASQPRVFAAVIAVTTAGVLPVFLVGGLAVQVRADLGVSEAAQGWVVFGYFGVSSLASMSFGRLVERLGPAPAMRLATLVAAAALGTASASPTLSWLLVGLGLGGLANALAQPGANALVVVAVPARRNGLAFGVKQSAIPAATLLAGLAVPTVALTVGWRWAFRGAAVLALVAGAIVPRVGPGQRTGRRVTRRGRPLDRPTGPNRSSGPARSTRPEAPMRALAVLGLGSALGSTVANSLGAFLTSSAVEAGLAAGAAGWLLSLASVVGLSSRLVMGWRADHRIGGHFRVVELMLLGGAVGLLALGTGVEPVFVAGTLLAFGAGWAWPGVFNLAVVAHNRRSAAAATGVTLTGTYAGSALGPLLFGYAVTRLGYTPAWLGLAGVAVLAALVIEQGRVLIERTPADADGAATPAVSGGVPSG